MNINIKEIVAAAEKYENDHEDSDYDYSCTVKYVAEKFNMSTIEIIDILLRDYYDSLKNDELYEI